MEKLKTLGYMDKGGELTEKGKGCAEDRLKRMDNGKLIVIEKYFAVRFNAEKIQCR